jgi:hypothetical protein
MTRKRWSVVTAIAAFMLASLAAAPARAGQAELDLLKSYIGDWSGSGVLTGGKAPESFRCRLNIAKGAQAKINYSGRCTLVNMNLSVAGTIAYDDAGQRYQAAMSSNAGFTGYAIGRQQGNQITFDLAEKQVDRGGNTVRIGARIHLIGGSITVDYQVEFNNSGDILTAVVPFAK